MVSDKHTAMKRSGFDSDISSSGRYARVRVPAERFGEDARPRWREISLIMPVASSEQVYS